MSKCYGWKGSAGGVTYGWLSCAENPGWKHQAKYTHGTFYTPSDNGNALDGDWGTSAGSITQLNSQQEIDAWKQGVNLDYNRGNNCAGCLSPPKKYDCINGSCIVSTEYNTPGFYQSLTDCQSQCSANASCPPGQQCVNPDTFCAPGKVCLEQAEYSEINSKISQLHNLIC